VYVCVRARVCGSMYSNLDYKSSTRGSRFPIIPATNVLSMADTTDENRQKCTDEH